MAAKVIDLDAHRPHLVIACSTEPAHCHVVPVAYLLRLASGDRDIEPLPECAAKRVLQEWLLCVQSRCVEHAHELNNV
jgi:hypothetical protein